MRVERVLPIAIQRLITIRDDALVTDAAKLLSSTHKSLVVVCSPDGVMVDCHQQDGRRSTNGPLSRSLLHDVSCSRNDARCHLLPPKRRAAGCLVDHERAWLCAYSDCRSGFQAIWGAQCPRCSSGPFGGGRV